MNIRVIAWNAVVAALYVAISLLLPAFRLSGALYVLAAFDPALIPGLALGNAVAGLHHRPLDLIEGAAFGWFTSWLCSRVGPKWSPLVVAVVPTILVTAWLTLVIGRGFMAVLPQVAVGYLIAAGIGFVAVLPLGRQLAKQGILQPRQ